MNFRDTLNKAKQENILAWELYTAHETERCLWNNDIDYTPEQFENLCQFVYHRIMSTDTMPYYVAGAALDVLHKTDKYTLDKPLISQFGFDEDVDDVLASY